MNSVFVLDTNRRAINPVHPGRARLLCKQGRAAVFRHEPFAIILKGPVPEQSTQPPTQRRAEQFSGAPSDGTPVSPLRVKIHPGSQLTGIAVVNDGTGDVVWAAEIQHRSSQVRKAISARREARHARRYRKVRYRQPRFLNRKRSEGWLPPSLETRVANVMTWVARLRRLCPVGAISTELVRFDPLHSHASLVYDQHSAAQYDMDTLLEREVREYLLEKWKRKCAYCKRDDVPLNIDHVIPLSRGGNDRLHNLAPACHSCVLAKGSLTAAEFGHPRVEAQAHVRLRDTANNLVRWTLYRRLQATGLPVETGTGGLTAYNRAIRELAGTAWLDAACVGVSTPATLNVAGVQPILIRAVGHGNRQMCRTDKYGFPRLHKARRSVYFGFRTGDLVSATVPSGKYPGTHRGRVAVRAEGTFRVGNTDSVWWRHVRLLQRADGYTYSKVNR